MEPFGYIYIIINLQNNKVYIGYTTNLIDRKNGHFSGKSSGSYIDNAIRKYGRHNFRWEVLGECSSFEEMEEAEITCIEFFQSNWRRHGKIYGYNETDGGGGTKGRKAKEETKLKISKSHIGKKHSIESKLKISIALTGRVSPNKNKQMPNEVKLKISESSKGKKRSIETKQKMSVRRKGIGNNFYGKKHSEATKKKMHEAHSRRINERKR